MRTDRAEAARRGWETRRQHVQEELGRLFGRCWERRLRRSIRAELRKRLTAVLHP